MITPYRQRTSAPQTLCDFCTHEGLDYYAELDAIEAFGHPVQQLKGSTWSDSLGLTSSTPSRDSFEPQPLVEENNAAVDAHGRHAEAHNGRRGDDEPREARQRNIPRADGAEADVPEENAQRADRAEAELPEDNVRVLDSGRRVASEEGA